MAHNKVRMPNSDIEGILRNLTMALIAHRRGYPQWMVMKHIEGAIWWARHSGGR